MKKSVKIILVSIVAMISAISMASCSFLIPSREFQLCENYTFPETYKAVYGSIAADGTTSSGYSMTVDANGNMHYYGDEDTEFYYIKNEDDSYTKYYKWNGNWEKTNQSPNWETSHQPYVMTAGKYYYYKFYGKVKKLDDVNYLGRDCYAYRLTLEDSTGKSYTVTTVKEVYIDKETCMFMREIITDYKDPTAPEMTAEKVGTCYGCIEFTTNPEAIVPPPYYGD